MKSFKYHLARLIARMLDAVERVPVARPVRRVLLVNRFGIGDVLLSTPAISAFRVRFPEAHLAFWARKDAAGVLQGNPHLNGVVTTDFSFTNPARDYDLAVPLVYHPFQTLALRGVPYRAGYLHGHRVHSNALPVLEDTWTGDHLVELGNTVARAFQCGEVDRQPRIFLSRKERDRADGLLPKEPFLAVSLQTKVPSKSWPLERMKQIVSWCPVPVVIIGGPSDRAVASEVEAEHSVTNLVGRLTLRETAAVLERCKAFLVADSGPMHLGFSVKAPTVAIFGYTDPKQIFLPSPERVLLYHSRPCAPHFRVGRKDARYEKCETGDCMRAVTVEEVKAALSGLLK